MLRGEIRDGVQTVRNAIEASQIHSRLAELFQGSQAKREADAKLKLIDALRIYAVEHSRFGVTAQEIERILGIYPLRDPELWQTLIEKGPTPIGVEVFRAVASTVAFLPRMLELLGTESTRFLEEAATKDPKDGESAQAILTIVFPEQPSRSSTPARICDGLMGTQELYSICAELLDENPDSLSVVGADGGSDKSFDLLGAAKAVEQVREIFFGIWDRIAGRRRRAMEFKLDSLAKSLTIMEKIDDAKETLGPERAAKLHLGVERAIKKLIPAEVTMPDQENYSKLDPRALTAPVSRLLVSPASEGEEVSEPSEENATSPSITTSTTARDA